MSQLKDALIESDAEADRMIGVARPMPSAGTASDPTDRLRRSVSGRHLGSATVNAVEHRLAADGG
jgi:hypothetical protein